MVADQPRVFAVGAEAPFKSLVSFLSALTQPVEQTSSNQSRGGDSVAPSAELDLIAQQAAMVLQTLMQRVTGSNNPVHPPSFLPTWMYSPHCRTYYSDVSDADCEEPRTESGISSFEAETRHHLARLSDGVNYSPIETTSRPSVAARAQLSRYWELIPTNLILCI